MAMVPSRADPMVSVLVDACGWVSLIDAGLNLDISLNEVVGKADLKITTGVREELSLDLQLLDKMISGGEDEGGIRPLQPNEMLMVNSATATSVGTVANIKGKKTIHILRF